MSSSGPGYITLSLKRASRMKSSVQGEYGQDKKEKVQKGTGLYSSQAPGKKETENALPVRREKPFKPIPKFEKNEMVIRPQR